MESLSNFFIDDDVVIEWAIPNIPCPLPRALTLYDFYLDPHLEAWATLDDYDDGDFGWQTSRGGILLKVA